MLASPLLPSPMFSPPRTSDEAHYRPAKDIDAFNSLLPPPVEFVEGSSSGALVVAEGKYEAINASPKLSKAELPESPRSLAHTPARAAPNANCRPGAKSESLHPGPIDITWPKSCNRGTGLFNNGNTCFLNSALQCLIHTPPLLHMLLQHSRESCRVSGSFCMACSLRLVASKAHTGSVVFSPSPISNNLQVIAKSMRKGRQEDTHEFLRYAIDALQKSCLAGHPPKIDSKLAETTWVHKIFGGRLRSRVTCQNCGHNSDTFDRILDLSLDIYKCDSLREALQKFIAIDYLKGADKYKCEKCKKHVNAEKRFTIHDAPLVLTVHLKRFSPLGRKIGQMIQYDEHLALRPYMSENQFGPTYSLYGVICHAGGGPNSGHYYAFVKSKEGRWWEMNDEETEPVSLPKDRKSAYMLFYIQNKGQVLEAAVNGSVKIFVPSQKNGLAAAMRRKRAVREEDGEDQGVKVEVENPFIGPVLPPTHLNPSTPNPHRVDPQAAILKAKIIAAQRPSALDSLGNYSSGSDNDEAGMDVTTKKDEPSQATKLVVEGPENTSPINAIVNPPSSPPTIPPSSPYTAISPSVANKPKKRKSPDSDSENTNTSKRSTPSPYVSRNPFNNHAITYGKKRHRRGGI